LLRIVAKARRIGLVTPRDVVVPLLKLPVLLGSLVIDKAQKKKRRKRQAAARARVSASNKEPSAR
jgi:hypothetical protein